MTAPVLHYDHPPFRPYGSHPPPAIPDMTLPHHVLGGASQRGNKTALVEATSGRSLLARGRYRSKSRTRGDLAKYAAASDVARRASRP